MTVSKEARPDAPPADTAAGLDLTALRRTWADREAAAASVRARVVLTGLRRPARDPDERAWLAERGEIVFVEDEAAGEAARRYYARKYTRPHE
jgi:hypothetical protein